MTECKQDISSSSVRYDWISIERNIDLFVRNFGLRLMQLLLEKELESIESKTRSLIDRSSVTVLLSVHENRNLVLLRVSIRSLKR